MPSVINQIDAHALRELTIHVGRGQSLQVVQAIGRYGAGIAHLEVPGKLCMSRLLLIFEDEFESESIERYQLILLETLSHAANIMFLFSGEVKDQPCPKTILENSGFEFVGTVKMAANNLYIEESCSKEYETYDVYGIIRGTVTCKIGYRAAIFQPTPIVEAVATTMRQIHQNEMVDFDLGGCFRGNYINNLHYYHAEGDNGVLEPRRHNFLRHLQHYADQFTTAVGQVQGCCVRRDSVIWPSNVKLQFLDRASKWGIPGWEETRVQTIIYFNTNTEFKMNNGLYFMLPGMNYEGRFFIDMVTTRRVIFICTTSDRRRIISENMNQLLRNADHVVFMGTWWNAVIDGIATNFVRVTKITLMQIHFRSMVPTLFIFNAIGRVNRTKLRWIHVDGRATFVDQDIGSLFNGIHKFKEIKLDDLLIVANVLESDSPQYKCSLGKHVMDVANNLLPGGSGTTMVAEHVEDRELSVGRLFDPQYVYVMAPIPYPIRTDDFCCKLCIGYHRYQNGRHVYFVCPPNS